ncbi:uncharacterized protein LOC144446720 [Glandiceps talaboti]
MAEGGVPSSKILDEIDDRILLCPICMDRFKSPKILQCFHTFCEHCLTDWVKTNKGNLICPTCKQTWPLPSGGATKVGNNCFMNDLLEIITKFSESTKSKCEICEKGANYWCKDCGQYFCDDCIRAHKVVKALQEHQFMTVEEYNTKMRSKHFRLLQPRFCDIHPTTPVEFYCDVCQVPACLKCNVTEHTAPDHKMITLEKAFEKYSPTLNQYRETLEKEITAFKQAKEKAENVGRNLDGNKEDTLREIKKAGDKIQGEARKEGYRLMDEAKRIFEPKRKRINSEIDHLSLSLASVESVHSYLTNLLMYGGPVDIMAAKKELDRQVEEKAKKKRKDPKLNSDVIFQENVQHIPVHVGRVLSEKSVMKDDQVKTRKLLRENREFRNDSATENIFDQVAATIDLPSLDISEDEARTKIDDAARKAGIIYCYKRDGKSVLLQGNLQQINYVNRQVLGLERPTATVTTAQGTPVGKVLRDGTDKLSGRHGDTSDEDKMCAICLSDRKKSTTLPCKHKFCKLCITQSEKVSGPTCPICKVAYGIITGDMPPGTMTDCVEKSNLPGYPGCGTIVITYTIPSGIQGKEHPNPGKRFTGTSRTVFLPDNADGRQVLRLLKIAFDRKLTFTIGTSVTTGLTNTIVWNDIHHKTSRFGGPQAYGYPDPNYLYRVTEELAAKGVK